VHLDEGVAHGN